MQFVEPACAAVRGMARLIYEGSEVMGRKTYGGGGRRERGRGERGRGERERKEGKKKRSTKPWCIFQR